MSLTREQALEMFRSDDLIGIGMEADALRRKLHPDGVVSYIIDRNINYTNICTEYCSFCAFYAPVKGPGREKGYLLDFEQIYEKIAETVEMGGTGVLMQGGINPDLKIDWFESLFRGIKQRFPQMHLHCLSASEIIGIAEYSNLSLEETIRRLMEAGLQSIPGGGAEILDDEVRAKVARLKCTTQDWLDVHRIAHKLGMKTTATMMFGVGETEEHRVNHFERIYRPPGRDRRLHRLHPLDLSAQTHRPGRPRLARIHRRRVPQDARHLTHLPLQLPQRTSKLGHPGVEGLPDGPALRRQRRGSVMLEENVVKAAGTSNCTTEEELRRIIRDAGFRPVQRDTLYRTFFLN